MSDQNLAARVRAALEGGEGILRLAPTWVPRSFLMPGGRLKLAREDLYALGTHRGGIDERWFASTTAAANEGAPADEGLSYVVHGTDRFTLKDADRALRLRDDRRQLVEHLQALAGLQQVLRQPRADPAPHAPEPGAGRQAGPRRASPRAITSRPSSTGPATTSRTPSSGSSPARPRPTFTAASSAGTRATTASSIFPRPIDSSPAPAGWFPPTCCTPPARCVTYEPQWGSDVFGMYQSMVEGRRVPWELLVKDVPEAHHHDLDYLVEQLDWEKNVDPEFKKNNYLEPIVRTGGQSAGYVDKWIVYGTVDGKQLFSACELTVEPGRSVTIKDPGAYGLIVGARKRTDRQAGRRQPQLHPVRRGDPGRGLRHRQAGRRRGHVPQHRQRAVCEPALLRARYACRSAQGGRSHEERASEVPRCQ